MTKTVVAAFYRFAPVADPARLRADLFGLCSGAGLRGTLLVAPEGVNGTVAGSRGGVDTLLSDLRGRPGFAGLEAKESLSDTMPFLRLKVREKAEIVTLGQPDVDPTRTVGTYVAPGDWNALIARDDVVVIDTRNDYEVAIGRFRGAIDPETASFRDFPAWWQKNRHRLAGKKLAMYCTGGIRCEKSTSYLMGQGVEEVFHLDGGILKYLEAVPREQSTWEGACFVFDQRVSVVHGLDRGDHALCFGCRRPMTEADRASPKYERGVSCPACFGTHSADQIARFRERQRQVDLARARGEDHIGQAG